MLGLVVPAECRLSAGAKELWKDLDPDLIRALTDSLKGRSVEVMDLDALARSLDMDRRSEEFREFARAIDLNGDDTITPEEVDFAFR
ncbi:hypothetical protein SNE40_000311 [Patella caerulea]|uniref:EF-hand domain-containing protein n=1 Tax=Patella caerulea TaxID=87958 RepID=A0AAN8Q9V2_PATCE